MEVAAGELAAPQAHVDEDTSPDAVAVGEAVRPPRKRRRLVISCTECHRRKQKCDRKDPCTNCTSRGKELACHYEKGALSARRIAGGDGKSAAANPAITPPGQAAPEAVRGGPPGSSKAGNFGYSAGGASTMELLRRFEKTTSSPGFVGDSLTRITAGPSRPQADDFSTRERYRSLIRQLPARTYVEKLVGVFFDKFNVYYYPLEQDLFLEQLAAWNSLPFSVFSTAGPLGLSPEMRAFPATLFQVVATALLTLDDDEPDATFDALKYATNMLFQDLAADFSETGSAVLSLLGKQQMSLNTVQAGFLRCSFLKYTAQVTEAWHAIGSAIRDAQEVGLHRQSLEPRPPTDADAGEVLRHQWQIQHRRWIWHMLCHWDMHAGLVLGRPQSTDGKGYPPFPVDCVLPTGGSEGRSKRAVVPRGPDDPPTPMTRNLWALRLLQLLREVVKLEASGPCPRDFGRVDQIHREMKQLEDEIPPYFRIENPDTRFDDSPECRGWLRSVRTLLPQLSSFGFFALHRPFVFTRERSRTEALKACIEMLRGQRLQFLSMSPADYRTFSIFFGTFDAVVLSATIFLLFPRENNEMLPSALQHFEWAVERFEVLSARNHLARSAVGVLRSIRRRLRRSLGYAADATAAAPASESASASATGFSAALTENSRAPTASSSSSAPPPTYMPLVADIGAARKMSADGAWSAAPSSGDTMAAAAHTAGDGGDGGAGLADSGDLGSLLARTSAEPWTLPSEFDWSAIQTLYPTGDLIYNELMIGDPAYAGAGFLAETPGGQANPSQTMQTWPAVSAPPAPEAAAAAAAMSDHSVRGAARGGAGGAAAPGVAPAAASDAASTNPDSGNPPHGNQFEGNLGDDSIWQVLNLYTTF